MFKVPYKEYSDFKLILNMIPWPYIFSGTNPKEPKTHHKDILNLLGGVMPCSLWSLSFATKDWKQAHVRESPEFQSLDHQRIPKTLF